MMETSDNFGQQLAVALRNGDVEKAKMCVQNLSQANVKCTIGLDTKNVNETGKEQEISIKVHIEDRNRSGDFVLSLKVKLSDSVQLLKGKMLLKYRFPKEVQRWVINKRVGSDHDTLKRLGIRDGDTVYLYLMSAKSVGLSKEEFDRKLERLLMNPDGAPPTPDTPMSNVSMRGLPPSRQRSNLSLGSDRSSLSQSQLNLSEELSALLRSQEAQGSPSMSGQGSPSMPGQMSRSGQPPPDVYEPVEDQTAAPGRGLEEGEWSCPICTFHNKYQKKKCRMCDADRPDSYQIPTVGRPEVNRTLSGAGHETSDGGTGLLTLPMTGVHNNLQILLKRKTPNQDLISWMKMAYTPVVMRTKDFIKTVVTCVCEDAIRKTDTVYFVEQHKISERVPLLMEILDNQVSRMVEALYALQTLYHKLQYPEGILPRLFEVMFNEGTISLDAFRTWERNYDDSESKIKALYDTQLFLNDLHTDADIEFD
ncbi:ranBP-type and C3HC4-type zinc finger-containing protein 1-like [Mizuhopecten yessoensis]|uniref:RanBP-type and C3HC4-type zinc finger-containing protein 1 n=1 Tax=Mizuhopecten yessoensis TaxID=6573 RepID=A0A210PND9_MIZYE|nr:ranBP-type and C3HC4-type zinc finger-containing protein 1-like [Mizuhopecten yessoensis]XP_021379270.1 ranBP-type and C3HC4-type zinc finger-containing protein 1-like [Mizuhopecten yessoensis]XP_021379271.1 ranBP-type and C3HC4-type zinc finger-containing protein 1-like [Mizuhopecten yessoensis]XP_021379272.1 ranBP-type and C3HC4-type zinc finger-containing protein 1-like [Mizuhopecten yessoensis]XP_021379273.1 ranBP-type and C3HC4-type zinc finger-containing protein 1-like [Mizuhopecten ye